MDKFKVPNVPEALGHLLVMFPEAFMNFFLDGEHEAFRRPTNIAGETLKYRFDSFKEALSIFKSRDDQ